MNCYFTCPPHKPRTLTTVPLALASILLLSCVSPTAMAVELAQVISRENPSLGGVGKTMSVGRDGKVYIVGGVHNEGFVLRVSRDGRQRFGGKTAYAITGVAANADGIVTTSNAHFAKAVHVYSPDWTLIGKVGGFTGNDDVGWNGPGGVEVGASGDFYGLDQHDNAIVRISPEAKIVRKYPIRADGAPEKSSLRSFRFRVCEATESFFFDIDEGIRCADFAGRTRWVAPIKLGGNAYSGFAGAFDVAEDGHLWVIDGREPIVRRFDAEGNPVGQVELKLEDEKTYGQRPVQVLRLWQNEIVLRRNSQTILFEVFSKETGQPLRQVPIAHERLAVRFDEPVWKAGQQIPFAIDFDAQLLTGKKDAASLRPDLKVWLRPLNTVRFAQLTVEDGNLHVPEDTSGLYQVRVTAGLDGSESEYLVQTVVEIRSPGAIGSISLLTPLGRVYYGRGEAVPVTAHVRTREDMADPELLDVQLLDRRTGKPVWERKVETENRTATFSMPAAVTAVLDPGEYLLTVAADSRKWTVAPQYLSIGKGLAERPDFHIVRHGDYYDAFPDGDYWNTPEQVARHLDRSRTLGTNRFVDRLGHGGSGKLGVLERPLVDHELTARLEADPIAIAPEKAQLENAVQRTIGGYGAHGVEQQAILLYMDAGLPIGTGFDKRTPEKMAEDVRTVSRALREYPAFRGWSWAANWWFGRRDTRLEKAELSDERKAEYLAALKKAEQTGEWSPILEEVSDIWLSWPVEAEQLFDAALQEAAPGKKSAMTAPYRQPLMIPPIVFRNADEVDLHFQAEQIQWPQTSPFNVDFYKRPGKPAWGHPELYNDDGTGDMIVPTLLQMTMRGADGIGQAGRTRGWASPQTEPRATGQGATSIHRAVNNLLREHGELLGSLEPVNRIAVPVSTRMMRIEDWKGIGGWYFTRVFEAYQACLYAHRPVEIVFVEDLEETGRSLADFDAVIVVSQTVQLDPRFVKALKECQTRQVPIHYDETCRESLLEPFGAKPLGIAFDRVEHDPHTLQDDTAYIRFQRYFLGHAARLTETLGTSVEPVARCDNPEVLLSECARGDVRALWVVNNTLTGLDPVQMWRVGLTITNRLPVVEEVQWNPGQGYRVLNLMTGETVDASLPLRVDLRTFPACVFVAVKNDERSGLLTDSSGQQPPSKQIGSHLRDLVVSTGGDMALVSAANWDQNLFGVDLENGSVRWRTKVGHHFAYAPQATSAGFTVRGFDLLTPEGYHLYRLGDDGDPERRFALYGLPKKATSWANAKQHTDPIDNFAASPDGGWVASAGDLGLAVWDRHGQLLWSDDWWERGERKRVFLLASDAQTLVTMSGSLVTANRPEDGDVLWQHRLGETGSIRGGVTSQDGHTIVLRSTAEGGRLFVLKDGRLVNSLPTSSNEVAVSPDGRWVAATDMETLKIFDTEGGLRWSMAGDDVLRYPRFSPDGRRIAVGSELGTLSVLDVEGHLLHEQDTGSLPVVRWMPSGDLVVATWLGRLFRLDGEYRQTWSTILRPDVEMSRQRLVARDDTPSTRIDGWGNAAPEPAPLTPNLLAQTDAIIRPVHDPPAHGGVHWQNDVDLLRDGQATPPEQPWLSWSDLGMIDSGWRQKLTLEIDTFRTQIRLTGVTIVEDPAHPESWQRDLRLQHWDPQSESWIDGPYLLSNHATHTHWFDESIEAARFRFVTTGGGVWPYNNLRWGELVFHGEVLGASHPDAVAKRAVAVLFDEQESDLKCMMAYGGRPFAFKYDDAVSGGKCIALTAAGSSAPAFQPPFGHAVPNWDFPIVENPEPGQYRYLEFAWKALSEDTTGITLHVGPGQQGHLAMVAGEPSDFHVGKTVRMAGEPPNDWETVRVDLWKEWGRDFQLRSLSIASEGSGAAFDNIRLGRSLADLEKSE